MDWSIEGFIKALVYIVFGIYSWLEVSGINAYATFVLFGLMVLDMILGIGKARVVKSLPNPTSKVAKKGILAKTVIFTIPVIAGLVWSLFDKVGALKIVNLLIVSLAVAEGYSNIGNAYTIYTGEVMTEFDAITYIFKKLAEKIKQLLNKII